MFPEQANTVNGFFGSDSPVLQGHILEIELEKTADQEKYRTFGPMHFRNMEAASQTTSHLPIVF
jgi:hypothetical protein